MVTLICGLSNSGKTTFSEQYGNVIHLDDYGRRINEVVSEATGDIVVEGVFVLRHMRKKLLESYRGTGRKVCIWLDVSPDVCEAREDRGRPTALIWNCYNALEPPTYEEGWDEIIAIR